MELDDVLYRVEGYILKKFHHLSPDLLEDVLQEAKILAWKKHQDGKSPTQICVAARYKVISFLQEEPELWTGQPSRYGGANYEENKGKETRQQIREYIDSYSRLHGHRPTAPEIAKHLGITRQSVYQHLERLYLFSGPSNFFEVSLDKPYSDGDDENYSVTDTIKFGYSFEDELIDRMDTHALMRNVLTPRERQWMYHLVFEGQQLQYVADLYGYSRSMVQHVARQARNKLKEAV